MSAATSLVLRPGEKVLIDGRPAEARDHVDGGRVFLFPDTGNTITYANTAQVRMAREGRLTTMVSYNALSAAQRDAIATDLGAFAPEMRDLMLWRRGFVMALEALPLTERRTDKGAKKAISTHQDEIEKAAVRAVLGSEETAGETAPLRKKPSARMVLSWHRSFLAAGRDVRALADLSYRKGHRNQLPSWIREEIHRAIEQVYATQPPGSLSDTRRRAITLVRQRAEREGIELQIHGGGEPVGVNTIKRVLAADFEVHDVLVRRFGKAEADRIMEAVGKGPQASWPLQQVEVDHTPLDIFVIDDDGVSILGRPWMTALRDRFSGCIIGICLSFHPPSWTTVMEALRFGVVDKTSHLKQLGGIDNTWDCFGAPDELICDNGKDFHSVSMQETEAALNMRITYLPRKKGWLKGRIERWFGTMQRELVHTIAGTTLASIKARKFYDAEASAFLTLAECNWLISKWIVDIDHQDGRNGRRVPPAELWAKGMRDHGAKPPPPAELLAPLTGLTTTARLGREGVFARCLQWNSNAFSALRNRIGTNETVTLRIDPMDLQHAWVLDPERRKWVEGDLVTEGVGVMETLHQYEVIKANAKRMREPGEDKRAAIARARGEMFDFIQERREAAAEKAGRRRKKTKIDKARARFETDGRKPHEHIADTRYDAAASLEAIGSHDAADDHTDLGEPAPSPAPRFEEEPSQPSVAKPSALVGKSADAVRRMQVLRKPRRL